MDQIQWALQRKNMTFDLEGQGQGQIVKRLLFCDIRDFLRVEDKNSNTYDRKDLIFYQKVAHESVFIGY